MTPLGVGTLSESASVGSGLYETSFVAPTYRLNFSVEVPEQDNMDRAVGCLLMSCMPTSYVHDAVTALWKSYQFAVEDENLQLPSETYTQNCGVALGVDASDY